MMFCNSFLIWTQLSFEVFLLVLIAVWPSCLNVIVFFWPFNCFINNVTNLLKVRHHILHQKQESCQRLSQWIYSPVLHYSIGTKAFYIQIHFYLPDIQHPADPIIFHDFLPFFGLLLRSPTNSSLFALFLFPKKKKIMLLHPQPSFTKSLLLTVTSISDQQQGKFMHSEFRNLPLIHSMYSSDTMNFSQTTELSKCLKISSCPIYLKLSNVNTKHKLPNIDTMSDKILFHISYW